MGNRLVYSSEKYFLDVKDLLFLDDSDDYIQSEDISILVGDVENGINDKLLSGRKTLEKTQDKYVEVFVAYYTISFFKSFLVNCIKPLKRKYYKQGSYYYHTSLNHLQKLGLERGSRNAMNAYEWSNKKWAMSESERNKRYDRLYQSLKKKGYLDSSPILILLNRNLGVKDQILQGHHRISICNEVGIDSITIRFWTAPKAGFLFKFIERIISFLKGTIK